MKWPWSKKGPEPAAELVFHPMHGPWETRIICHCGHITDTPRFGGFVLCPECGHRDKWTEVVSRDEWEETEWTPVLGKCVRGEKTVVWTPDHCEAKP